MRSLLFVPGDSRRKFDKALLTAADGIILDLEDAIAPAHKAAARPLAAELLAAAPRGDKTFYVRINPLDRGMELADIAAGRPARRDGNMLHK
jgi:citrate lyase subunit beta/citryl-CoA lyase